MPNGNDTDTDVAELDDSPLDDRAQEEAPPLGGAGPPLGGGATAAPAQPTPQAGGGFNPLGGLDQIMGALGGLSPQAPPAAQMVQQKHGGLLTGLVGVLLDGLASGMAPTAQQAFEMPMRMQQMRMQQQQMQLQQQKMQEEMAMEPVMEKAKMAQAAINIMHAGHLMRDMKKEQQLDVLGAQGKYFESAVEDGRAEATGTAPTQQDAIKRVQELQAQNKDKALNIGYLPTKWDDNGDPSEYTIYEAYPKGTLQSAFHYTLKGDSEVGVDDEPVDIPAGTSEADARNILSTAVTNHKGLIQMRHDAATQTRQEATQERQERQQTEREREDRERDREAWARIGLAQAKGPVTPTTSFGQPVGIGPTGQPLPVNQLMSAQKAFNKDYIEPLNTLDKTYSEFQRIRDDPKQTGAEKVTALLNAVGVSASPLKGQFRVSLPVIQEHAAARNIWQDAIQKFQRIAGSGGPVTSQQIADYTRVAQGVLHDAYVTAGHEAIRQHLPVDMLPKPTRPGDRPDALTAKIYLDVAGGNKDIARQEAQKAGWGF